MKFFQRASSLPERKKWTSSKRRKSHSSIWFLISNTAKTMEQTFRILRGNEFHSRIPHPIKPFLNCEVKIKTAAKMQESKCLPSTHPFWGTYFKVYSIQTAMETKKEESMKYKKHWNQSIEFSYQKHSCFVIHKSKTSPQVNQKA